ncbi:MAG: penicillin-binding protein [Streptomycetaceae bacterium]|nr:penicillin-binding protein [Streptomycetaceae bacterium]
MQGRTKGAVIGGVCAVMVGAAGYGGYTLFQGMPVGKSVTHATAKPSPTITTPPSVADVAHVSHGFLAAWSSGDTAEAAGLTDDVAQAAGQLAAFRTQFHATSLTLSSRPATGTSVPFSVRARFDYHGQQSSWTYNSSLTVTRDATGRPAVKWAPSVLYPTLTQGETLEADASVPPPVTVADRSGKTLTAAEFPSLAGVLSELQTRYANKMSGGTPGAEIRVKTAAGQPGQVLHQLAQGKAGKPLPTTIDSVLQAEAQKAVTTKGPDASVVVIQPSTGGILAVANNPAVGYNKAMMGTYASGSTFKVITASTLLSTGKYTPSTPLACPKTLSYGGLSFHNVEMMQLSGATVAADFAASCNTAFISTANVMPDGAVESEARDVFGLGLDWSVGVSSFDGSIPTGTGAAKALTYIGQGRVQLNPLDMASVAATAESGVFRQPYIVPPSVDGRQLVQAPQQLSAQVDQEIQSMMRLTARQGTAAPTIGSLSGNVGAKTGTAEVDGQAKPNSWFLAYRDDVAAAALVPNTGEGYKFAGPIVTAILQAAG